MPHSILMILMGSGLAFVCVLFYVYSRKKNSHVQHSQPEDLSALGYAKDNTGTMEDGTVYRFPFSLESDLAEEKRDLHLSDVLVFFVMSYDDQPYSGYELFRVFQIHGLEFGDGNVFHRWDQNECLYTVAQATEPGTFNENLMKDDDCVGLAIFLKRNKLSDAAYAFDRMVAMMQQIVNDLGGVIQNDQHHPIDESQLDEISEYLNKEEINA